MRKAARTHGNLGAAVTRGDEACREPGDGSTCSEWVRRRSRLTALALGFGFMDRPVTFDEATGRLLLLARENSGTVTAAQIEADERLSSDHDLTSAAARALEGSTNIFSFEATTSVLGSRSPD